MSGWPFAPTQAGFLTFLRDVVEIDPLYLPDNSSSITYAFCAAQATVNCALAGVPGPMYQFAVYNLGASLLLNYAQDQPGRFYFKEKRKDLNINAWQAGVVASTADSSTSTALTNPAWAEGLTILDLQRLKDPYGRTYLGLAQAYGPTIVDMS